MRPETAVRRSAAGWATISRDSAVERGFNRPISPERHNSSVSIDRWSASSAADRCEHGTAGPATAREHPMHVERSVRGTCQLIIDVYHADPGRRVIGSMVPHRKRLNLCRSGGRSTTCLFAANCGQIGQKKGYYPQISRHVPRLEPFTRLPWLNDPRL